LNSREAARNPSGYNFTAREQQVLELLLDGQSNREIAKTLEIEERTVKSYVAKLMGKTGVRNRTALSMQAISARTMRPE
jgi:two-component system nitrate/nitrite response regulator NarL